MNKVILAQIDIKSRVDYLAVQSEPNSHLIIKCLHVIIMITDNVVHLPY